MSDNKETNDTKAEETTTTTNDPEVASPKKADDKAEDDAPSTPPTTTEADTSSGKKSGKKAGKKAAAAKKESSAKKGVKREAEHTMETRTRKKAREAIDLISDSAQKNQSLINLLGSDYEKEDYSGPSDEQLKMMFRVFDRDADGFIGSDELAYVFKSMGKRPLTKKIQKMLDECDTHKNGKIALDDFVAYMKKKAAKKAKDLREKHHHGDNNNNNNNATTPEKETKGKGKKASAKKSPKKASKKADSEDDEPKKLSKKTSSIFDFYTHNAGLQEVPASKLDKHDNPQGVEYDLGVEGAFTAYKILVGMFYDASSDSSPNAMSLGDFKKRVGGAMERKGFQFDVVTTTKDFIGKLKDYDVAWIVSKLSTDDSTTDAEFATAVEDFHKTGGGLFIFADNEPFYYQANLTLKKLFNVELSGNTPAQKTITVGDGSKAGFFNKHLITSGIKNLFEGRTVSYPTSVPDSLSVLATSTDNHPVILLSNNDKLSPSAGRVVVDCGFTKLWVEWDSAGTERYVKNATVWLVGVDSRLASDAPLTGKLEKKEEKKEEPVWQFKHGTFHDYDKEASKLVEEAYQDWKQNPYIDVRSVKSGVWHYQVDFKQMTQTNIEHQNHTSREVRRVLREVYA